MPSGRQAWINWFKSFDLPSGRQAWTFLYAVFRLLQKEKNSRSKSKGFIGLMDKKE